MKKLFYAIIATLLLSSQCFGFMLIAAKNAGDPAGCSETPSYAAESIDASKDIAVDVASEWFIGGINTSGGSYTVCAVEFYLEKGSTSATGENMYVEVWALDGNDDFTGTVKGTSNVRDAGDVFAGDGWFYFTFDPPVTISNGDAIAITSDGPSGNPYISADGSTLLDSVFSRAWWDINGANENVQESRSTAFRLYE